MKQHHIAMLGCGRIGQMHLNLILENFSNVNVVAIVDNYLAKEPHYKNIPTYPVTQLEDVLSQSRLDAVFIAANSTAHVDLIKAAIKYKKHIFCEKPISFDVTSLEHLDKELKQSNIKLQVGLNRRWDPDFCQIKRDVDAGKIGNIHIVKITNRDPKRASIKFAKRSGGMFLDFNIHDFDTARFITGSEVEQIYAAGAVLVDPELKRINDIDTSIITMKMTSGVLVVIDASRETGYGYDQRLEVFGEKGNLQVDNIGRTVTQFMGGNKTETAPPHYSFIERYKQAYINQFAAFLHYLATDDVITPDISDARKAVEIAIAAEKSLADNQPVIV
ncbi:inositol 2-dehydrogenase [Shewanella surugensis]|uniref:Inositol 2-dehydrogenase n=1 Tax=Shewanella surugensis TaxID=212020 RepID=A0ABT0LHZ2_9GAMM|nr:inositol 2-dehydrogenase [Shewanella surugensis]MCL1127319.1 inositol 2-dehydrogenase [Shewanella surugensis]